MINYGGGSTHPPPVYDDGSSKPLKKRKKPNPQPQNLKSDTAPASAERTIAALATPPQKKPEDHKHQQSRGQSQQQLHKRVTPAPAENKLSHDLPQIQVDPSIKVPVIDMKKNLDKSSEKSSKKPQKASRRRWTPAEDEALKKLVVTYGNSWASIAQRLPTRTQRTCRARWRYVLDPNIKRTQWTREEEDIIATYHDKFGNKWSKIAKHLEGRSAEAIRNHWNCRHNSITAKWKGRKAKEAAVSGKSASGDTADTAAWQASSSGMAPPSAPRSRYNSTATAAAATEAATKAPAQKESADKIDNNSVKKVPPQPPALYPSNESATDRGNWSRVTGGRIIPPARSCEPILFV